MTEATAPVSVVIPCYLCRDSIGRALASVASQTLPPSEIVLVDDASPDGGETVRELERLAGEHGATIPVRLVLSERNGGPGSARNRGWAAATQPYVAFLDADDAWHVRKIEIQYAWMRDHGEFGLTGHRHVLSAATQPDWPASAEAGASGYTRIESGAMLYSNALATRTVMLRRDLPFRFREGKRYAEDYLLWLEMLFGGVKAARIEVSLAAAFKPDFGADGLSANLWRMERGELGCYVTLYRQRLIGVAVLLAASSFSLLKFARRWLITVWAKIIAIFQGSRR